MFPYIYNVIKSLISRRWTDIGPITDRHWTDIDPFKSRNFLSSNNIGENAVQRYNKFLNCANFLTNIFQQNFTKLSKTFSLFTHYQRITFFINTKSFPKHKFVNKSWSHKTKKKAAPCAALIFPMFAL